MTGSDADGDFPWERVKTYADAHGLQQVIDNPQEAQDTATLQQILNTQGVAPALHFLNSPAQITNGRPMSRS